MKRNKQKASFSGILAKKVSEIEKERENKDFYKYW